MAFVVVLCLLDFFYKFGVLRLQVFSFLLCLIHLWFYQESPS